MQALQKLFFGVVAVICFAVLLHRAESTKSPEERREEDRQAQLQRQVSVMQQAVDQQKEQQNP